MSTPWTGTPSGWSSTATRTSSFSFNLSKADENGANPYRKPQYLLLNLALGGDYGGPIDDANLPQKFVIAYVRVYQREEAKK